MAGDITYEEAVELFELLEGEGNFARWESATNKWGADVGTSGILEWIDNKYGTTTYKEYYQKPSVAGEVFEPIKNSAGNTKGYSVTWTGTPRQPSIIDSNVSKQFNPKTPINTTATIVEEKDVMSFKVGLRESGRFAIQKVAPAVVAAGWGITIGKAIDETLYNLSPTFWDSHNMSSLDPDTWSTITADDDSLSAGLFDLIFGLNDDGTTQAYMDEDALAYLSWWMQTAGVFNTGTIEDAELTTTSPVVDSLMEMTLGNYIAKYVAPGSHSDFSADDNINDFFQNHPEFSPDEVGYIYRYLGSDYIAWIKPIGVPVYDGHITNVTDGVARLDDALRISSNKLFRSYTTGSTVGTLFTYNTNPTTYSVNKVANFNTNTGASFVTGTFIPPIEGISNQPNAQTPVNTDTWTDMPTTKRSIQDQYPTLWDNAKHQDYVDENGQNRSTTLIPINLPNIRSPFDTQPTSGERTQDEPLIDPTTATKELIDTITKLISGTPPINTPPTGSGGSPAVVAPVGSASSLWAIYNPTQAQVDAFGSWLWSSSFVDQIKKLFNDPMQAIIGIHKVFATPSIGGTATIKVGYLDSQVPSDYIDDQYTTVDCGTVNLYEYFGNVFDYSPYTRVSLYLPFIGIVDLDVADVMRSSINVTYHVDVLSGACLADVTVTRDLNSAVLYQYSGSAIVTYPVSSGNYMGMVAGVLSVAGGVLGTIASGGALAPALIGGAVGASHLHTNVSHSGGFSGCAGAMGGKIPYLIISRPQTAMAGNYGHFTGRPANSHVTLRDCSGFTRVKSVYVGNVNATDEEKDMIEAQLKAGVLI